jgi:hypothetical protein
VNWPDVCEFPLAAGRAAFLSDLFVSITRTQSQASEDSPLALAVSLVTVAVFLYVAQGLFRRAGRWAAWSVFFGFPLILTPVWVQLCRSGAYPAAGVFPWVKLYSIQIAVCWLTALRFTPLGCSRNVLSASYLLLPLNILEAVTQDLFGWSLPHILVAATGILLIVSAPHPLGALNIDTTGLHRDLVCPGMTRAWIVGYTLWDGVFVYLNFPVIAGHQVAVLTSAFAVGMWQPSRWLQARTYTLAIDLLLLFTLPQVLVPLMDSSFWTTPCREDVAAGICLAVPVWYLIHFFVVRRDRPSEMITAGPSAAADRRSM